MNSLTMQRTTLPDSGIASTMNRREPSDSNGAQASTFEAQVTALHNDASAEKAQVPSHGNPRASEGGDQQASGTPEALRPIVESLTMLRLSPLQKADQKDQPAEKNKPDQAAAFEATGGEVVGWPLSALGFSQISGLFAGFGKTNDAEARGDSGAAASGVEASTSTNQDELAAFFPATQFLSGNPSPNLSLAMADAADSAGNIGEPPTLQMIGSANASLPAATAAPKRMTLQDFLAHLPSDLAQALSDEVASSQGANADGVLLVGASNQPLSGSAAIGADDTTAAPKLTLVSLATHLPASQTPAIAIKGAFVETPGSMEAPPFAGIGNSKEESVSAVANDAFGLQLETQGVATTPLLVGSPASEGGSLSGAVSQTTAPASPKAVSDHAKDHPTKVLTFQLEPEDLGAVTVRMQLTKTRVSLKIDVNSTAIQNILTQSRDELSQALSASGHSVDDIAIRVSPAPVPSDTVNDARQNDSRAPFDQRGEGGSFGENDGAGNNRDGQSFSRAPRKEQSQEHGAVARDSGAPGASGVYL
ncbi:flagellar hook-length control protein FliK [Methylocystis sp. JR02]|uniref:flagellar hook-length control protein FliK n=1 Tax=Methylocystis sp. JR02 TaxID=3046284 RepID=UPI0024BAE74F|nr:flagellar hook-length control protein FliK [Methylocystis sp. JR02]MDJ0449462.1 flagellar hook-length control protein FliK [Methylocystis sp. JR02]